MDTLTVTVSDWAAVGYWLSATAVVGVAVGGLLHLLRALVMHTSRHF